MATFRIKIRNSIGTFLGDRKFKSMSSARKFVMLNRKMDKAINGSHFKNHIGGEIHISNKYSIVRSH